MITWIILLVRNCKRLHESISLHLMIGQKCHWRILKTIIRSNFSTADYRRLPLHILRTIIRSNFSTVDYRSTGSRHVNIVVSNSCGMGKSNTSSAQTFQNAVVLEQQFIWYILEKLRIARPLPKTVRTDNNMVHFKQATDPWDLMVNVVILKLCPTSL